MKTIKIKVYEYSELSDKAKQKAHEDYLRNNDMSFIQSMLNDECGQLLKAKGITCTSNFPVCMYDLSHSQGSGLMFEGTFEASGVMRNA